MSVTPHTPHSEKTKMEAVQLTLAFGGNRRKVSEALGVPYKTLQYWETTPWWKKILEELKKEERLALSAKLYKIVSKSMELLDDRLEFGDYYLDQKTGQVKRKPIGARDLHVIMSTSIDQREKIERNSTTEATNENVMDKLAQLAESFKQVSNKKPTVNVTDVVFVEEPKGE